MGLTVAVTGPTGEIGKPFVAALDRAREVDRVIGMARRPFDPAAHGWRKVEYRQGDVLDRASVESLCTGADVVVHLAFIIVAGSSESEHINLEGSRNVFESAVAAGGRGGGGAAAGGGGRSRVRLGGWVGGGAGGGWGAVVFVGVPPRGGGLFRFSRPWIARSS